MYLWGEVATHKTHYLIVKLAECYGIAEIIRKGYTGPTTLCPCRQDYQVMALL